MNLTFFKSTVLLSVLFLLLGSGLKAQESLSLEQAIDYALKHNASYLNAGLEVKKAQAQVREVTGYGLPQVNASVEANDYVIIPKAFIPSRFFNPQAPENSFTAVTFQPKYTGNMSVSLSQLLFDGSYLVGLQASRTVKELAVRQQSMAKIDLIEKVQKAYYLVLVNQERRKLLEANIIRLDSTLKELNALYEKGFAEKIDVDRLKVARNNLAVETDKVATFTEVSKSLLKLQIGMPVETPLTLTDRLAEVTQSAETDLNSKVDFQKRIEYQLLQTQLTLNQLELKNNRAKYLPRFFGFASYGANTGQSTFGNFLNASNWFELGLVGLKLEVPIFAGFSKSYKSQQLRINIQKTENTISEFENAVRLQAMQSAEMVRNNLSSLKVQKENLELSQEVLRVSRIKTQQGVGSNLEVINAEASFKEAQTNYYSSLYDLLVARVDLLKSKGELK